MAKKGDGGGHEGLNEPVLEDNPVAGHDEEWSQDSTVLASPLDREHPERHWVVRLRVAYRAAFQPMRMVVTWAQIVAQIDGLLNFPMMFALAVALRLQDVTDGSLIPRHNR